MWIVLIIKNTTTAGSLKVTRRFVGPFLKEETAKVFIRQKSPAISSSFVKKLEDPTTFDLDREGEEI